MFIDGKIYTAGEAARLHSGLFGVNHYDPEKCENGYTLFSPAYGYTEYLVDMRGLVVYQWPVTHANVAEILPNGNLFVHNCGSWLEELDPDGNTVWRWDGDDELETNTHHDYYVDGNDIVFVGRITESVRPGVYEADLEPKHMATDVVWKINRDGDVIWKFSFGDHIEEIAALAGLPLPIPYRASKHAQGEAVPYGTADWAHTNTVEVLPETPLGRRDERFRAGNVMVSFRALDVIAIFDPVKDAIVWCYGLGVIDGQHQPTMLPNGNILIFDNGTYRGHSIVLEIDPPTGEIVWKYENGTDFFSPFRSGAQRLTNGNTLITECDAGHLFEVTMEGEIVWDYWSPFVARGDNHLGKRIHRSTRYSAEAVQPLFDRRDDRVIGEVTPEGDPVRTYSDLITLYRVN
jgi:outer membrane protein assembly factor BamB